MVLLSAVSVTHGQLRCENMKQKISEMTIHPVQVATALSGGMKSRERCSTVQDERVPSVGVLSCSSGMKSHEISRALARDARAPPVGGRQPQALPRGSRCAALW